MALLSLLFVCLLFLKGGGFEVLARMLQGSFGVV